MSSINEKIITILNHMIFEGRQLEKEVAGSGIDYLNEIYADKTINLPQEPYEKLKEAILNPELEVTITISRQVTLNL